MKNIEFACYALLASAFVLAAVLVIQIQNGPGLLPEAQGEMVLTRGNLTIMTALTKEGEEAMFVLDSQSQTLLIYLLNLPRQQIETKQVVPLANIFGAAPGAGQTGGVTPRRSRTPR